MSRAPSRAERRLSRLRVATRINLYLERGSVLFLPLALWVLAYAAFSLFAIPAVIGLSDRLAALIFYAVALCLLWRGVQSLRRIDAVTVDRRLESASGIRHRPLDHLNDRIAGVHGSTAADLWDDSQDAAALAARALRFSVGEPVVARSDRHALRFLVLLAVIVGIVAAGHQAPARIAQGFFPWQPAAKAAAHAPAIVLQITPPSYTGLPITLASGGRSNKPIAIPAGSTVKARVHGGWFRPTLRFGATRLKLTASGGEDWQGSAKITQGDRLVVSQGLLRRADIAYRFLPARPPTISLQGAPETLDKGQWRFNAKVQDDYGIADLILHMRLDPAIKNAPGGAPVDEDRKVLIFSNAPQTVRPVFDLSWHRWAGLPVILTLEARNHEGLSATSAPVKATIPLRAFRQPVAAAIAAQRRDLIWTPERSAIVAAYKLEQLLAAPGAFGGNVPVFLALRSASSRLYYMPRLPAAQEVVPLLWQAAVTIEDGSMPFAARDLRQAQDNLEKTLADPNATPEQVAQAMDDLRKAMGNYLTEALRRIQRNMMAAGMQPLSQDEVRDLIRPDDIAAFLDEMQAKAAKGDRRAAQDMLAQLSRLTDSMNPDEADGKPPKDMQQMADALRRLDELVAGQKALIDRTQAARSKADLAQAGKTQDELGRQLDGLTTSMSHGLAAPPANLGNASGAMRRSSAALGKNAKALSLAAQQEALGELQKGQDSMRQQLRARLKQMMTAATSRRRDPMGHDTGDDNGHGLSSGATRIPDHGQRRQVQDILRTLRQRSGELGRPEFERDYYRRLMDQY